MTVREKIKHYLECCGFTQYSCGKSVGIFGSQISRHELKGQSFEAIAYEQMFLEA